MTSVDRGALPYRPCVGIVLANTDGLVFAGQRIDTQGDAWQMPQGGIEEGEDPEAAALRELEEETEIREVRLLSETDGWLRYDLPPDVRDNVWNGRFVGQAQKWFAMLFNGDDSDIRLDGKHAEFRIWKWMDADALLNLVVDFKQPLYQAIFAEFATVITELRNK